jgi:glycosyltransferase involved in cell wall biosynthesis
VKLFGAPTRAKRGIRFVRGIASAVRERPRPDAIFCHMVPLFLLLAAPFAKPRRIPLLLWYTHWSTSRALRAATRVADVVLSADAGSFPLRSAKVRGIGHAIDTERFAPSATEHAGDRPLQMLALGRYTPVKGYETLLEGIRIAVERGLDARLEVRGPELTSLERDHRAELERRLSRTPALVGRVHLGDSVPRELVPALIAGSDVLVSTTQPRSSETFDKVVCEGAACGVPVLASNRALEELLDGLTLQLRFPAGDAEALAQRLLELGAAGPRVRHELGAELRRRVAAAHSIDSWADAVVAAISGLRRE